MKIATLSAAIAGAYLATSSVVYAGDITIKLDDKRQVFEGVGGTIDSYLAHWTSLSDENTALAAKMLGQDLPLLYVKNYINGTPDTLVFNRNGSPKLDENGNQLTLGETSYDRFVEAVADIRQFQPDIKVQISIQDLPDHLEKIDPDTGKSKKGEHDETIPDIYKLIGQYYYDVLLGFQSRGLSVEQLDLLNEPGGVHRAIYLGRLFDDAIDELKAILADPITNPTNIPMPEVVGPSLWGVAGTVKWLDEWKSNLPGAWENLDIVSTHGYEGGWVEQNYTDVMVAAEGKPFINNEQTAKLQNGDGLYEVFNTNEPDYIGDTSIALRISDAVNGGVNQFYIFNLNNPSGNNAALVRTPFGGVPSPSKVYNGFRQLTAYQAPNSRVVGSETKDLGATRVLAFRNDGENEATIHVTNISGDYQPVNLQITETGAESGALAIQSVTGWRSDEFDAQTQFVQEDMPQGSPAFSFDASPYSVNTFKVTFDPDVFFPNPQGISNIALGKRAKESSRHNNQSRWRGSNAVDGDVSTSASRWIAKKPGQNNSELPQWLSVDLGSDYLVSGVNLYTGTGGNYQNPLHDFTLQRLVNGEWLDFYTVSGNTDSVLNLTFDPIKMDAIRLHVTGVDDNWIKLYEMEVFGEKEAVQNFRTSSGAGKVMQWDALEGASSYNLYESLDGGESYRRIAEGIETTRYINAGSIEPGVVYSYTVAAVNEAGEISPFSNVVDVCVGRCPK